jgi:uroporphyrinogen-III synthase
MSKKAKSSPIQPLTKVRVLVGRARHQASALSAELRKLGAEVLEIPFIEIRKPRSFRPLDSALRNLGSYDWLILTSVNGVEAMWDRMEKVHLAGKIAWIKAPRDQETSREGHDFRSEPALSKRSAPKSVEKIGMKLRASAAEGPRLRIAAIGPATKAAIEQRGMKVDIVPKEYVAESVVRSLKNRVKGKRVLLVRAKVARDVIPRELRKAGARVDVVEAYETVIPLSSRARLRVALKNPKQRPQVITFTSSSTVRNFVALLDVRKPGRGTERIAGIKFASIGPVTSLTLREFGFPVHLEAREFTIPGLVQAISQAAPSTRGKGK